MTETLQVVCVSPDGNHREMLVEFKDTKNTGRSLGSDLYTIRFKFSFGHMSILTSYQPTFHEKSGVGFVFYFDDGYWGQMNKFASDMINTAFGNCDKRDYHGNMVIIKHKYDGLAQRWVMVNTSLDEFQELYQQCKIVTENHKKTSALASDLTPLIYFVRSIFVFLIFYLIFSLCSKQTY